MDTRLCRTFLTVARRRSFSTAADELHVVQSTVTARVQALESQLGVQLLDRLPGGAWLTSDGERVARYAQELIDAEDRLIESAASRGTPSGDVVLGAPESVCAYRLPAIVADLARSHPRISVHLNPTGTQETCRRLLAHELHLGLILDERPAAPDLTPAYLGTEPVSIVAGGQYAAAAVRASVRELAGLPYFLLEEGCSYGDSFVTDLTRRSGSAPRTTRFGSIEAVRACVQAGLGLSVLPNVAIDADVAGGRLVRVEGYPRPGSPLHLITDGRRSVSPATAAVADAVRTAARKWYPSAPTTS